MNTSLSLRDVSVPGRLSQVSLDLPSGKLCGLVGPNGAGKSTLLQVAAGLLDSKGEVLWGERPIQKIQALERGRCTSWIPQELQFEFGFSVRSVVAQGRFAHGDDEHGVDEALARLDLARLAQRPVNRISGGERQRVLLARALVTEASLHLWDEPLAPLDPRHALEVLKIGRQLAAAGVTVFFSLHDLRLAACLDHVIVMHEGRLCASGIPSDVLTPGLLMEVFGVKAGLAPGLSIELP